METDLYAAHLTFSSLRHPNLVCLIGISLDDNPIYLITEYMAKVSQSLMEGQRVWGDDLVCGVMVCV